VEQDAKARKNLFSSVGIGARNADLVLRWQPLTLHHALRWGDQHLFLTSIIARGSGHLDVSAALVRPAPCQKDADKTPSGPIFPGVLTEKYAGHEMTDLHAEVVKTYVLVTPKAVTLAPGSWVTVDGAYYRVLVPHELDEWKNEYEIMRREDC
jgi:hypothetical protein